LPRGQCPDDDSGLTAPERAILQTVVDHPQPPDPEDDAKRRRLLALMAEGALSYARPFRFTTRRSTDSSSCIVCGVRFAVGEPVYEAGVGELILPPLHRDCLGVWLDQVGRD
jgi:hypothetical protein